MRHRFGVWWSKWAGSVAFAIVVIGGGLGLIHVEGIAQDADDAAQNAQEAAQDAGVAISVSEAERQDRIDTVAGVIRLGCRTDNAQDLLLADLIEVSLSGRRPKDGDLTDEQRRFLETFTKAREELLDKQDCELLVIRYKRGDEIPVEP